MNLISILLAAFGIGLLIFVHELGHFLAARLAGVRVDRFSLGFGPRLCGFRWGDTDFRVSAVPFGGYVLVAGADPSDRRYPREVSLYARPILNRALFWSGGVLMNVLFALIVFPVVFSAGVSLSAPTLGSILEGSPAWEADVRAGDRVLALDGREILSYDDLATEVALHGHRPLQLRIERDGEERTVTVMPRFDTESGLYRIGADPSFRSRVAVLASGPAFDAGLRPEDELVRIAGEPAGDGAALQSAWRSGQPIVVEARRDGESVQATITPRPSATESPLRIGVRPALRVVAGMRPGSELLGQLGLARGDRVLAVDGQPFLAGDFAAFATGPSTLRLLVGRDGRAIELSAPATPAARGDLASHVALERDASMRLQPVDDGAAKAAGLLPGDLVRAVDGEPIEQWEDLQQAVEGAAGKPLRFALERLSPSAEVRADESTGELPPGRRVELTITPRRAPAFDYGLVLEQSMLQTEIKAAGFGDALRLGVVSSLDLVKQAYVTLKRMITGEVGAKNLGGIVRISEFSYRAAERGSTWFWYFLALISLNLAFVNLLPIPVLDGGHLLFLLIERVKGSPVSERVFGYSQVVGLVFVLLLVLFVTYNDIMRYL